MSQPSAAIVLAAGQGTRMKSALAKVLHPVAGRPMILWVMESVRPLGCDPVVVVVAPGMEKVAAAVSPARIAEQSEQRGTADAVASARAVLRGFLGDILVVYGDTPLISTATLERLLERRRAPDRPAVVVLGMRPDDPGAYGRLILGEDGSLRAIVEARDATPAEQAVTLCNSGVMVVDGRILFDLLAEVGNDNAKGEYYLTDIVGIARRRGLTCVAVEGDALELAGVNSRLDLAAAEAAMQQRLRAQAMREGATLLDPETVYFSHDTKLGRDVTVGPNVVFGPGVEVGEAVEIRAFCHLEGARIEPGALIGPFARLRPGAEIGPAAHIGNFVEVKNATVGRGAKANHLTYLGDASVGAGANVGAGTITCNYDGVKKHRTEIGDNAFIGSNSALVAPVSVGAGAYVASGSVITDDVEPDALAVARGRQVNKPGWAVKFRRRMRGEIPRLRAVGKED